MNNCEKKGCSICELRSNPEGLPHVEGQTPHPEVTDVRNRELLLFLLVIIIMIALVVGGAVVYSGLAGDYSLGSHPATGMVFP